MNRERALRLVRKARETNRKNSVIDRRHGFGVPEDGPQDVLVRTIMAAIWCGLTTEDWNAVAEGYCLLSDLHMLMTGVGYAPEELTAPRAEAP